MPRFQPEELLAFVTDLVAAMGTSPEGSREVADHLVKANLAGHDSHGVIRLKQYHTHIREGRINPAAEPLVSKDGPTTAVLDGNLAWGQVVANQAVMLGIEKARKYSTAAICVRHCYHVGRVGVYSLRAAKEGFIAQVHCNCHGVARVAPWGGVEPRLATNPIAVAIPTRTEPVLVDITTSVVAEGKVRVARNAKKAIPEGWVNDKNGQPTTNPADLYEGGTILPLGGREGHKGYALSLLVDLLGGVLSGAGSGILTQDVGNGLFVQITDPAAFGDRDEILDRVEEYLAYLRSSQTKEGVEKILLPGEPELRTEAKRREEGIDIDEQTWSEVMEIAGELGVEFAN